MPETIKVKVQCAIRPCGYPETEMELIVDQQKLILEAEKLRQLKEHHDRSTLRTTEIVSHSVFDILNENRERIGSIRVHGTIANSSMLLNKMSLTFHHETDDDNIVFGRKETTEERVTRIKQETLGQTR